MWSKNSHSNILVFILDNELESTDFVEDASMESRNGVLTAPGIQMLTDIPLLCLFGRRRTRLDWKSAFYSKETGSKAKLRLSYVVLHGQISEENVQRLFGGGVLRSERKFHDGGQ